MAYRHDLDQRLSIIFDKMLDDGDDPNHSSLYLILEELVSEVQSLRNQLSKIKSECYSREW